MGSKNPAFGFRFFKTMMMKLTFRPQMKHKNRFSVFSGDTYLFSISGYTHRKLVGKDELYVESVEAFQKECVFPEQYDYCLGLLSRRMYSEKELADKLKLHGCPPNTAEEILETLKEKGYLSDEQYREQFLYSRQTYKKQGFYKIRQELSGKGISLDASDYDFTAEQENLKEQVALLVQKQTETKKIYSRLIRKGYRFSDITDCLRNLSSEVLEEDYEEDYDA
ncbi:MAG: regulatory protein RecX [Clostridia bacterium]|nr:regulatory protein RecX [Clostridia bacterium]